MKYFFFFILLSIIILPSCNNDDSNNIDLKMVNIGMTKIDVQNNIGEANNIVDQNKFINQEGDTIMYSIWFYDMDIAVIFVNDSLVAIDSNRNATMQKNSESIDVNVILNK